jgi:hypothetical protein
MSDNLTPQFYTPDGAGNSQEVYKTAIANFEALKSSSIKARSKQGLQSPLPTSALDNIPGIPFERGTPNPDVFYQGEDIVYDLLLVHDGKYVNSEDYEILALIKTSPRASTVLWEGKLDYGIYKTQGKPGYYELWLPANVTEKLLAGAYYIDILLVERIGRGEGRFDRKYVILQTMFNLEYSNFSPSPESVKSSSDSPSRSSVEETWPNKPDTIGRSVDKLNQYTAPTGKGTDVTANQ